MREFNMHVGFIWCIEVKETLSLANTLESIILRGRE